ncbi:MAG: biotin--[acetyl-CoA-carboxylase] ligase [Phycisphaerales bacterium JB063]
MSDRPPDTPITAWADTLAAETTYARFPGVKPPSVQVYQQTASTQDLARRHPSGWFVAIADQQTAGRGRLGRAWVAPPGSAVLMSLAWPNLVGSTTHDTLAYRVAVAVAKSAQRFLDPARHRVRIKWPNDILVDSKKLAGILIEQAGQTAVVGIGFNVGLREPDLLGLPEDLAGRITSLAMLGQPTDRLDVAAELIGQCHIHLSASDHGAMLDEWRSRSPLGYNARFRCDGQTIAGTVIDLDPALGLIVRRDSGEIVHLPAATTSVLP